MHGDICAAPLPDNCAVEEPASRPRSAPASGSGSCQRSPANNRPMSDAGRMRVRHPEAGPSLTASVVPYLAATLAGLLTFSLFIRLSLRQVSGTLDSTISGIPSLR